MKIFYISVLAIALIIQTFTIHIQKDYISELKEQNEKMQVELEVFKKLSYSLSDYCIDLEKDRASCNTETKECN